MSRKIRIVEVARGTREDPKNPNIQKIHDKYYKLQKQFLGIWWDCTEPEHGMIWPTFVTLEEAEDFVNYHYYNSERVVKEYNI